MTPQKIVKGPSKWDVMLGFFEGKDVTFTMSDGSTVTLDGIDSLVQHSHYDSLSWDDAAYKEDVSNGVQEAWLIQGDTAEGQEVFIEYLPLSRSGLCSTVTGLDRWNHYAPQAIWRTVMGITDSPYKQL